MFPLIYVSSDLCFGKIGRSGEIPANPHLREKDKTEREGETRELPIVKASWLVVVNKYAS